MGHPLHELVKRGTERVEAFFEWDGNSDNPGDGLAEATANHTTTNRAVMDLASNGFGNVAIRQAMLTIAAEIESLAKRMRNAADDIDPHNMPVVAYAELFTILVMTAIVANSRLGGVVQIEKDRRVLVGMFSSPHPASVEMYRKFSEILRAHDEMPEIDELIRLTSEVFDVDPDELAREIKEQS